MGQRYNQLTEGEHNPIYALRNAGHKPADFAESYGRLGARRPYCFPGGTA